VAASGKFDRSVGETFIGRLRRGASGAGFGEQPFEGGFAGAVPVFLVLLDHAIGDPVARAGGLELFFEFDELYADWSDGPVNPGICGGRFTLAGVFRGFYRTFRRGGGH
jgi:hypothetical protein